MNDIKAELEALDISLLIDKLELELRYYFESRFIKHDESMDTDIQERIDKAIDVIDKSGLDEEYKEVMFADLLAVIIETAENYKEKLIRESGG